MFHGGVDLLCRTRVIYKAEIEGEEELWKVYMVVVRCIRNR